MPPELPSSRPPPVEIRPIRVDRTRRDVAAVTEFGKRSTPLTSLIGREVDIAAARALLVDSGVRLLTLTGPGGVGKTRLALAVATEVAANFPDGDAFVPLAAVSDPALVLSAIARALDMRETLERPVAEALVAVLDDRHFLLVLDNFEHVLAAAADLFNLLTMCPRLTVLVTSRSPLQLSGEQRFLTTPLTLPTPGDHPAIDTLPTFGAIRLFVERAQSISRDFALDDENAAIVAAICRHLEGLPLAIELAAAWVHVLPPATLLARLEQRLPLLRGGAEDQPARLRTMREAIAWSYDLLSTEEARLFRRLAVFVDGFTLEAAEWVEKGEMEERPQASPPFPPSSTDPLDLLAGLIDKSLLQPAHVDGREPRYAMLEMVREFALERLVASGEAAAIAAAHAAYFLDLAERAEPVLLGPRERYWQARIDAELGNLRGALGWSLEHDVETMMRIGAALWVYWAWYQLAEGRRWLSAALARPASGAGAVRARALTTYGALAALEGDAATASEAGRTAVTLASEAGDPATEALARWITACGYFYAGDVAPAAPELDRALALFEQATTSTDRGWGAYARSHRGIAAFVCGDTKQGVAFYEEALARARAAGSDGITLVILGDLAAWLIELEETSRARGMLQEALTLGANHPGRWLLVTALSSLPLITAIAGEAAVAARQLGAAAALCILGGIAIPPYLQHRIDRATMLAMDALGAEDFATAWAAGRADPGAVIADVVRPPDATAATIGQGSPADESGLTVREREVLSLLVAGVSDKEIAAALFISPRTASSHVAAILAKLGVDSRTAAAAVAFQQGLV